jgi:hypothetical protein
MFRQHGACVRVDFAEAHGAHSRTFEAQREASDAAEQIKHTQGPAKQTVKHLAHIQPHAFKQGVRVIHFSP